MNEGKLRHKYGKQRFPVLRAPGLALQQRQQPVQDQQDDEDPDVREDPQPDPAGPGLPAGPVLQ